MITQYSPQAFPSQDIQESLEAINRSVSFKIIFRHFLAWLTSDELVMNIFDIPKGIDVVGQMKQLWSSTNL